MNKIAKKIVKKKDKNTIFFVSHKFDFFQVKLKFAFIIRSLMLKLIFRFCLVVLNKTKITKINKSLWVFNTTFLKPTSCTNSLNRRVQKTV